VDSRWSEADAREAVRRFARGRVNDDVALRVYSSRLLGRERRLVLHGGGNTSVKTHMTDIAGDEVEVLCVKGSGWDLAEIEPPGLPAVRLAPLKKLQRLAKLSDEDMVSYLRGNLLDAQAPNPSVETLLHAFLPHKFVDHTHADAVLALTDRADGLEVAAEVYDGRAAIVPYVMPGFALAQMCAEAHARYPDAEGLVLAKHGLFTVGASARESYERMIGLVTLAERYLAREPARSIARANLPNDVAPAHAAAPILRGAVAIPAPRAGAEPRRMVLAFRTSTAILAYVNGAELQRYAEAGPITPDHVIRVRPWPLIVPAPRASDLAGFRAEVAAAVAAYAARYRDYFARHNAREARPKMPLDPLPRVVLVPGVGLFGVGKSAKDAAVAADLAESTVEVVTRTEAHAPFESISEAEIFAMEYWSLEQAKLGKQADKRLAGHVVAVTGGASGIGRATAAAFAAEGADVAILDKDATSADRTAVEIGCLALACDVTDRDSVAAAFRELCRRFGGVDIVVSNAGAAWQGRIGEVAEDVLRRSFELNFYGHQRIAQAAVNVLRAQGLGGALLFNVSKQAINPGPGFGPYGLPKAATLALMRQYALDHGAEGIRANAVNADRIRTGLLTPDMIAARAKARGVTEADYMAGNLLGREVTAEDVAQAFVALALARATTGAVVTVDGGNIAAAPR
jgi:rhamnose utilization protein RhaD (predicted bifunctional aldolase and dehydrogenase)/NAD(P)-dependent dehydrogenase (short-subunit alcohol dehydrogenase family)